MRGGGWTVAGDMSRDCDKVGDMSSAEVGDMSRPVGDTRVAGSGARGGIGVKGGKGVSKWGVEEVCGVVGTESGGMVKEGEEVCKVARLSVEGEE
jgi:hypothetical protein